MPDDESAFAAALRPAGMAVTASVESDPWEPEFERLLGLARPEDRGLLVRRYRDGETLEEIAAADGVSRQRVHQRVHQRVERALERLLKRVSP